MLEIKPGDNKSASCIMEVLKQSWPASLTMLNSTITRFVDGVMVSRLGSPLGPASLSAQSVASIFAFVPESFAVGMLMVVNTYVSQNLGARRFNRCGQYAWAGILLGLGTATIIAPLALLAGPLFGLFQHGPLIRPLEIIYFRYMIVSILLTLPARVLDQFFFGIHRPRIVFVASLGANVFNIFGNWLLIYGHWGFPQMGLEGAAIASVASWGLQIVIQLSVFLSPGMNRRYATRLFRLVRWSDVVEIMKIGWASGLQFCNDMLSWSIFMSWLVGVFGAAHLAATSVAMRYMSLSFMPAVGIGIAATALMGKYIGQGRSDEAARVTHGALLAAMIYMGACGLAFWIFRQPMMRAFVALTPSGGPGGQEAARLTAEIIRIGGSILLCAAVFQLFDAIGIVYVGALRGAGDTRWPMVVTMLLSWGIIVGGGYATVKLAPGWGSIGPWAAASAYVIVLGIMLAWRFESGAWRKIDLLHRRGVEPAVVPEPQPAFVGELMAAPRPPDDEQYAAGSSGRDE